MNITRRDALRGAAAIAATGAVPLAANASIQVEDPLRAGVQALVDEIRQGLGRNLTTHSFWALQETADRLEALPGVQPVSNEHWPTWATNLPGYNAIRVLRPVGRVAP